MSTLSLALLALTPAAVQTGVPSMGDSATIDAIIQEGRDHSQVMQKLTTLCKKFGPRLTGSPELASAQQWAMSEFRKMGLKNVHLDEWGEVPVGFDRGKKQVCRMVEPFVSEMEFTTPAWSNGTNGVIKADAILCPATVDEIVAKADTLKGKWVLLPPPEPIQPGRFGGGRPNSPAAGPAGGAPQLPAGTPGGAPTPPTTAPTGAPAGAPPQRPPQPGTELVGALEKIPIAGIIRASRNELVVTSGTWRDKSFENHPGTVQVTVRKSDYDRIASALSYDQPVKLEIGAENRWYKGPIKQYNVVADLPGTEHPDEIVIVSGHFDSWNGPGSQGACDNGTGAMTAMEAARILTSVKARPKRTIRFILWSGEEQGLYGSTAYVKNHPDELPKISAVLVDDGGTNYQGGYQGIAAQKDIMEAAFAPVVKAFPQFPEVFQVRERMPQGGGSDHAPFNRVGVPGFFTIETGRSNYTYLHHTQHDNLQQAIPDYLVQSSTNHAVVAYNLACLAGLLPRDTAPLPPQRPNGQ